MPKVGYIIAALVDLFSRRVFRWSMQAEMTALLVTDALVGDLAPRHAIFPYLLRQLPVTRPN